VAFSADLNAFPVQPEVAAVVTKAASVLEECGAQVEELKIEWPTDQFSMSSLWLRITGMMYLSALEGIKTYGVDLVADHSNVLTPAFRDMLLAAQSLTTADVLADRMLRTAVQDAVQNVFDDYDFIASATLALPAVPNGRKGETPGPVEVNGVAVDPSIGWCLTYPFNFTGNPAASLPCGLTVEGLPVGLQLVGRQHADLDLLAACAAFESAAPWTSTYPKNR
jgi:amidase/aspartyl-tRNA(Asn)/glutamyl-tRNA(Gln) amidotransferase subunit A